MRHDERGEDRADLESNKERGLTIRMFGGMTILDSRGASFLPRSRKTRAIVAILALTAPRPILRMQLTALLWSQREKEQARASLRQAVHELQETLGSVWNRVLTAERHHLSIDQRVVTVDVLKAADPSASGTELLALFQHGFLEDLSGLDPAFDEWLGGERRRLLSAARLAGESVLRGQETAEQTIAAARSLLRVDPSHDKAWRVLIQAHIDTSDRAAALFACQQWREAMALTPEEVPPADMDRFLLQIRGRPARLPSARSGDNAGDGGLPPKNDNAPPADSLSARSTLRLGIRELRVIGQEVDPGLAPGLAEEMTTALSRFRWISCISASSLAAVAGAAGGGAMNWSGMDLDLFLDGTIQGGGSQVRITVRLLDMRAGGEVIWANRFDRPSHDSLAIQDEVASAIVAQVDPMLLVREGERATRSPRGVTPRDLVLRAVPAIYRLDRLSFRAAGGLLETALRIEPSHTEALAWYAYWHLFLVGQGWSDDPDAAIERAGQLADTAVTTDPNDARALTLAGHVRGFLLKRASEGMVLHERAIALNPNLALAWCFSGCTLSYLGNHDLAMSRMRQAVQLSPSDPHLFFFQSGIALSHLHRGEYEEAAAASREAIELNPWFSSSFKVYLAALGHLNNDREAAAVRTRLLKLEPRFTVRDAIRRSAMTLPGEIARYAEGLRRSGLPEG